MTDHPISASYDGQATAGRSPSRFFIVLGVGLLSAGLPSVARAQGPDGPSPRRFPIPYLANATKPADLDFMAAECEVSPSGDALSCRFRQLFLTLSALDPASCVVTTNGYDQVFHREALARWVSRTDPGSDECAVVETTTLEDGGGTHWTMTVAKAPTRRVDRAACQAVAATPEVYDWRSVKRKLPCTSIQPGALER